MRLCIMENFMLILQKTLLLYNLNYLSAMHYNFENEHVVTNCSKRCVKKIMQTTEIHAFKKVKSVKI